jgi:hypothetical protein
MIFENSFKPMLSDHVARSIIFVEAAACDVLDKHSVQSLVKEAQCYRLVSLSQMVGTMSSRRSWLFVMDAAFEISSLHHLLVARSECLVAEGYSDLFQSMPGSLDIVEVRKPCGEQAEAGNDKVEVAVNASESIRRYHANDEIEDPVGSLSNSQCVQRFLGQGTLHTVASAIPLLRLRSGKISAGRSHGIGPQVMP